MISTRSLFSRADMSPQSATAARRRIAVFIGHVTVTLVFVSFAALAVAAAVLDLISIRH